MATMKPIERATEAEQLHLVDLVAGLALPTDRRGHGENRQRRLNLSDTTFLVAESSDIYAKIFTQILRGFGAMTVLSTNRGRDAQRLVLDQQVDVLLCDVALRDTTGFQLVRDLRMDSKNPRRTIPMLITMGITTETAVRQARQVGASMVLRKPVSPDIVFDRLEWLAWNPRQFCELPDYFGPDRRVRDDGNRTGSGRRKSDVTEAEIDKLFDAARQEVDQP